MCKLILYDKKKIQVRIESSGLVPVLREIHWARFGKSESAQFLF